MPTKRDPHSNIPSTVPLTVRASSTHTTLRWSPTRPTWSTTASGAGGDQPSAVSRKHQLYLLDSDLHTCPARPACLWQRPSGYIISAFNVYNAPTYQGKLASINQCSLVKSRSSDLQPFRSSEYSLHRPNSVSRPTGSLAA